MAVVDLLDYFFNQNGMVLAYERPDGQTITFPAPGLGVQVTGPIVGLGPPPMTWLTDKVFQQDGELERQNGHKLNTRDISIPIAIVGDTGAEVIQGQRAVASLLNPKTGTGKLYVQRHDVPEIRYVNCRYASGLQAADQSALDWGDMWTQAVLTFHCFDPWAYDVYPTVATWGPTGSVAKPFFPLFDSGTDVGPHFGSSNVYSVQTIANVGDDLTYPLWAISGPVANPVLSNQTTGESFSFTANGGLTLAAGQTLVVDTRPGVRSVLVDGSTNRFNRLSADSVLFPLQLGDNDIMVSAGGVDSRSQIILSFANKWLSV